MAPGYKPLEIGQPQGIPTQGLLGQDFNTPAIDFTDAERIQAALRAQELSNQAQSIAAQGGQIKLDQLRRSDQDQQHLRDTLIAEFGGQSQQPNPNSPDSQYMSAMQGQGYLSPDAVDAGAQQPDTVGEFDPQKALRRATEISLQQGDLETAINSNRAANSGLGSVSNRLLAPEEIQSFKDQGLDLGAGATLADARLAISLRNSGTQIDKLTGIGDRFDQSMKYKRSKDAAVGVFAPLTDDNGDAIPISNDQKKNLSGLQAGLDTILRNGDGLVSQLQSDKYSIGDKMQIQKQEIANMLPAIRKLDNQGVRFNEFLKGIDIAQIGDDAELADRIAGTFTGQDPAAAVDRFLREIVHQTQIQANGNNGRFSRGKVDSFDPELSGLFDKYGVFGRGQPAANQPQFDSESRYSPSDAGSNSSSGQNSGISIPKAQSAPSRPGLTYQGMDSATGLPIYKKQK